MKKTLTAVTLAVVLLIVSMTGSLASQEDEWVYPEDVLAYMFRLGIACEATGISIPYDPYTLTDNDVGYFSVNVGSTELVGMYDLKTMRIEALTFPAAAPSADTKESAVILAAFCEEVSVTTGSKMTGDLFLKLGEIVLTQVVGVMADTGRPFPLGAYTFSAFVGDDDVLHIRIQAS